MASHINNQEKKTLETNSTGPATPATAPTAPAPTAPIAQTAPPKEMKKEIFFVTAALPYVNNEPHLGNLIGAILSADLYARYKKRCGNEVLYLCGTDEYGTTTEIKARSEGIEPRALCDKYHEIHKRIYDWFEIDFDVFGRSSTDTQTQVTHQIFKALLARGFIEKKIVSQLYCENCSMFLADRYVRGYCYSAQCEGKTETKGDQCDKCGEIIDGIKLIDPWCSECKTKPVKRDSNHLFLNLEKSEEFLTSKFVTSDDVAMSDKARGETKNFIKSMGSRCITRDLKWGTPVPDFPELAEFKGKTFYVWFDAPIAYLSMLIKGRPADYEKWLNCGNWVQFFGKDNLLFHSILFPATISASGLPYPIVKRIASTEFLTFNGGKISKSLSTGIFGSDAIKLSKILGITADYWRYYLARNRPEDADHSFTFETFENSCKELVNIYGNYLLRIKGILKNFTNKGIPITEFKYNFTGERSEVFEKLRELVHSYHENFSNTKIKRAGEIVCEIGFLANKFAQDAKIWTLKNSSESIEIVGCAFYFAWILIEILHPFIPVRATILSRHFICDGDLQLTKSIGTISVNFDGFERPFNMIDPELIKKIKEGEIDYKNLE